MKSIMLSVITLSLLSLTSYCFGHDLSQGTKELGGDLDLSIVSADTDSTEADSTNLSVSALYYVVDNLGLGFTWKYKSNEINVSGTSTEVIANIVGPIASFNIPLNENTSLKLKGSIFASSAEINNSYDSDTFVDGFGWSLGAGISFFMNDYVSFDTSLQYISLSLEDDTTGIEVDSTGISAGIGLTVYLK